LAGDYAHVFVLVSVVIEWYTVGWQWSRHVDGTQRYIIVTS